MLEGFFDPKGVAVIGASQNPTKLGYAVARNLIISGYRGALHFVNLRGGQLFGHPLYPSVVEVPDPVDLAVIIIPAQSVPGAIEECGQRGIRAVIVGSGGFREVGPEGAELEARAMDIARKHEIRVLGPNCIGHLDTHLPIDTTFLPLPGPIPGDIAFLSHSGAICEAVIDWARGQGFGLSRLISLGNQMDLTEADLLEPTVDDPNTRVIALYLEGVGDGQVFIERARQAAQIKPIVAIKVGRSERGRQAVASHTGAMAGEDSAFNAALRKAGVIRAETSEALFDWARALAWCPLPQGRRVAVLTNAGGPGAIAVDALVARDMEMADLTQNTTRGLSDLLPAAASLRNPVDMLASAGPHEYARCLQLLLSDSGVDSVMVILPPPPVSTAAEVAGAMIPVVREAAKPVVIALMGEDLIRQAAGLFRQARVPDYRFPERAASALKVLGARAERLQAPFPEPLQVKVEGLKGAGELLKNSEPGAGGFVAPETAAGMVREYGISTGAECLARTLEEALEAAGELGYPVALKVSSADLPHKSEVGGVRLNIDDAEELAQAFQEVTTRPKVHVPEADIQGVVIQPMVAGGQDVIVGVLRDEHFGPLVMFGSGGVEVEALQDVAFALAPLDSADLETLLTSTWAGRRLKGYRHIPPADQESVEQALLRLGQAALDHPSIQEIEINPLRVMAPGKGSVALDVRMRLE